jgi:hypothetical protein
MRSLASSGYTRYYDLQDQWYRSATGRTPRTSPMCWLSQPSGGRCFFLLPMETNHPLNIRRAKIKGGDNSRLFRLTEILGGICQAHDLGEMRQLIACHRDGASAAEPSRV